MFVANAWFLKKVQRTETIHNLSFHLKSIYPPIKEDKKGGMHQANKLLDYITHAIIFFISTEKKVTFFIAILNAGFFVAL